MAISWTKQWSAGDTGTILTGSHLRTLQDDIDAVVLTSPVADSALAQITTASKVSASAITGMVFWEDTLVAYENELVYAT